MGFHTVEDGPWPKGTSVSVWPESAVSGGVPTGLPTDVEVAHADGVVSFGGLTEGGTYVAFGHAGTQTFKAINQEQRLEALEAGGPDAGLATRVTALEAADTALVATDNVLDARADAHDAADVALGVRVAALEAGGGGGGTVLRTQPNVLSDAGNDATGVLVSTGLQTVYTAAKANVGGRTMETVFHPKGRYKVTAALNAEGLIGEGSGYESSQLWFPNDLGAGTFGISFQMTQTATKAKCGPRNLQIQGPNLVSGYGNYPSNMDGCRIGNAGLARDCTITGFRAALNLFKDHEGAEDCTLTGAFGIFFDDTQSGGDQKFTDITCSGCWVAAVALHPGSSAGGVKFIACHFGFNPVPLLKLDVQGPGVGHLGAPATPGCYDTSFTATTTNADDTVTAVAAITVGPGFGASGTLANGMRVVGPNIPAGSKIANYNAGAGTFDLQHGVTGAAVNATATAAGQTFYAATIREQGFTAVYSWTNSYEACGNAVMYSQMVGSTNELNTFRDCGASNTLDPNIQISFWPVDCPFNNVSIKDWKFDNSFALLSVNDATTTCAIRLSLGGSSLGADLGDLYFVIDALTGSKKLIVYQGSSVNLTGCKFRYSSGGQGAGVEGDLAHVGNAVVVGDLLMASTNPGQALKYNGAAPQPSAGVAMQAGATNDRIPRCLSGAIGIRVDAGNSTMFTAPNKWAKPDPTNQGCIVEAVNGGGVDTIPSGQVLKVVTHGLGATPLLEDLQINRGASTNDAGDLWITAITGTQFTVNVRSDPGASGLPFSWRARSREIIGRTTAAQASGKVTTRLTGVS